MMDGMVLMMLLAIQVVMQVEDELLLRPLEVIFQEYKIFMIFTMLTMTMTMTFDVDDDDYNFDKEEKI